MAKVKRARGRGSNSLREHFVRWEGLANNARSRLGEIAMMEPYLTAFDEVLGRIRTSLFEQDVQAAKLSGLVHARRADVAKARDLRKRVTGLVKVHFGSDSETLREFGLKPQVRVRRKSAGKEPEEQPEPAGSTEPPVAVN